MAKKIIVDAQVAKKMMGIVEHCSYCSVLDENNDLFVTGFDKKCDDIMARMWECYNMLDEASVTDEGWEVELYDCDEQDFNDLLFHAFNNLDDDEAFRKVMYHTFFTTECYNKVLDTLKGLTDTTMMESTGHNKLKGYVHSVIDTADCRFERECLFDDMIDNILGGRY